MIEDVSKRAEVDRFILERIDSIPQLEALLLLWQQRPEHWTVERVARRLWIHTGEARRILRDLTRDQLVVLGDGETERYGYQSQPARDRLLQALAESYRADMVRISTMIHTKPSSTGLPYGPSSA